MNSFRRKCLLLAAVTAAAVSISAASLCAQGAPTPVYRSQEVSEADGIPVLIKHLPDWESVRGSTAFSTNTGELKAAVGDHPLVESIDFVPGTEAVSANYPAGKLLIVEFSSPQGSADADARITAALEAANDGRTAYRRIGNYNAVVFDAADLDAAGKLLDQVKYEKNIQWLGENPFRISAERAFVLTTSDIFFSTVLVIVMGIGFAIVGGTICGYAYFIFSDRRRSRLMTFTDAGGMTRLNLDGFTPDAAADHPQIG